MRAQKKIVLIILLLFLFLFSKPQSYNSSDGYNFSFDAGTSYMFLETTSNLSHFASEFDNKLGLSAEIQFSKDFYTFNEIGFGFSTTLLRGSLNDPNKLSYYRYANNELRCDEVLYYNLLITPKIFIKSYLLGRQNVINPFVGIGLGYNFYKSILKYKDDNSILYGKNIPEYDSYSASINYELNLGASRQLNRKLDLSLTYQINITDYSELDVIPNRKDNGKMLKLYGIYWNLKIGLVYNFAELYRRKSKSQSRLPFYKK